jgi:hypothetical protein
MTTAKRKKKRTTLQKRKSVSDKKREREKTYVCPLRIVNSAQCAYTWVNRNHGVRIGRWVVELVIPMRGIRVIERQMVRNKQGKKRERRSNRNAGLAKGAFRVFLQRSVRGVTVLHRWDGQNPLPTRQDNMTDDFVSLSFLSDEFLHPPPHTPLLGGRGRDSGLWLRQGKTSKEERIQYGRSTYCNPMDNW